MFVYTIFSYTVTFKSVGLVRFLNVFERRLSPRLYWFDQIHSKNRSIIRI